MSKGPKEKGGKARERRIKSFVVIYSAEVALLFILVWYLLSIKF